MHNWTALSAQKYGISLGKEEKVLKSFQAEIETPH